MKTLKLTKFQTTKTIKENQPEAEEEVWRSVLQARDAARPYTEDIISRIFQDFRELHGDRRYGEDPAIICGTAMLGQKPVMVIGHQKGRDTKQRRWRNFGMPKPEGYRKARRAMKLAEKFGRPLITLIDTPGAYPGIDAEERGQAEAIAENLRVMAQLRIPIIVFIIGEGGSGGALAIGVGDYILMLENAIYSVITPEGCAAILWKSSEKAPSAAAALGLDANRLLQNAIIDEIVPEGDSWRIISEKAAGDADADTVSNLRSFESCETGKLLAARLTAILGDLEGIGEAELLQSRFAKFKKMGIYRS